MTTVSVPTTINHYPVVAAVLRDGGPDVVEGHVVCHQVGTQEHGTYCTWRVAYRLDSPSVGWLAENGQYDMTYTDALADLARRTGMAGDPWEVINDVKSSYELALAAVDDPNVVAEIRETVDDYLANHYGDA